MIAHNIHLIDHNIHLIAHNIHINEQRMDEQRSNGLYDSGIL